MLEPALAWGLFARGLAAVQAFALFDLSRQVLAFGGSKGIVPAHVTLAKLRSQLDRPRQRWCYAPSVLWATGSSDPALRGVSLAGACFGAAGALGLGGLSPLWCLCANVCLLSLDCVIGLAMPWDCLLLELGWLGALLPPLLPLPSLESAGAAHPAVAWMCRWLLWRLIFGFGKLKFSGTDHEKDRLYIRDFMIMQPIPSRLGWLLHVHAPLWIHKLLLGGMFFAEIIVPFFVFFTGWPRLLAALVLVGLQVGIQLHGNFGYFNVLTAVLCIPLLDQHASLFDAAEPLALLPAQQLAVWPMLALSAVGGVIHLAFASGLTLSWCYLPVFVSWRSAGRRGFIGFWRALQPFRIVHGYGVFPPHTAPSLKIVPIIQGSNDDGQTWLDYEWRDMICDVRRAPPFVSPRQPRVEYKMFYEALGMNADNFSAGLFQAHNPSAFAAGRTSFIDCLMARLLEGDSPAVEALFRTNPFASSSSSAGVGGSDGGDGGGSASKECRKPSLLRMRVFLYEPCRERGGDGGSRRGGDCPWWTRRDIGPQRPVMTLSRDVPDIWAGLLPEPEYWHWDMVYWRARCAAHVCSNVTDVDLLVPHTIHFDQPRMSYVYDGRKLQETTMEISKSDVASFWTDFVPLVRQHRNDLCAAATVARSGSKFPRGKLSTYEAILSRLSWTLAAQLQPLIFSVAPKSNAKANASPSSLDNTAPVQGPAPAEQLGSYFDLSLLCHHIIMMGEACYLQALEQPAAETLRAVMPMVDHGTDAWCACTPPATATAVETKGGAKEEEMNVEKEDDEDSSSGDDGLQRLSVASGFVLWAVLRYEVLCLHATKFRLNKMTCAPNNISSSVANAGFFELFDHVAAAVPLPRTRSEKELLGDWGAKESYPIFTQDTQLCWVEQGAPPLEPSAEKSKVQKEQESSQEKAPKKTV
jgi:hypothetical protein